MRLRSVLASLVGIVAVTAAACPALAAGPPTIRLSASRPAAINDGRDHVEIVAEVRDGGGSYVPDGTQVTFTSDLGQFSPAPVVATRAGTARVRITSIQKGTATITATVAGGGFARLDGTLFSDDPADTVQGNAYLSVQSTGALLYSAGDRVIHASGRPAANLAVGEPARGADGDEGVEDQGGPDGAGASGSGADGVRGAAGAGAGLPGARAVYRNLEVTADSLQVDCAYAIIRAEGNVQVVKGSRKLSCARLHLPINTGDGYAVAETDRGLRLVKVKATDLSTEPVPMGVSPKVFEMVDLADAPLVVTARHITLFPGEKLQFKRPAFYQDGVRIFSLPFYVLGLYSTELFTDQFLTLGNQGVGLDLPLYYDLTPGSTGIFRVRHGERSGRTYATRPGWSLDLTQAYSTPGARSRMSGEVGFTGVNRSDWGFRWVHSQEFAGDTRGSFFVDAPQHRALFGSANLNRQMLGLQLGLNLSANRSLSGITTSGREASLYVETMPRKVGKTGYMMAVGGNAGVNHMVTGDTRTNFSTQGVQARFYSQPFQLDRQTTVTNYVSVGNLWTNTGTSGANVLASVTGTRAFSNSLNLQMTYDFARQPVMIPGTGQHRVSANVVANGGTKWNLFLYGSTVLDTTGDTLMADFSYAVMPRWHLAVNATLQRFALGTYNDVQVGIGRNVGGRDVVFSYSTYNHRFYFDIQASRF